MSSSQISDSWYNTLVQNSKFEKLLNDSGIQGEKLEYGKCISLVSKNNLDKPFELRLVKCEEKKLAVCRKELPKSVPAGNPSIFPCLPEEQKRRKREDTNGEICDEEGKYQGCPSVDNFFENFG